MMKQEANGLRMKRAHKLLDESDMRCLGLHACMYKETSCAPRLTVNRKTLTRKGFRKIHESKRIFPLRKYLLNQGTDVNPTLLYYYKNPKTLSIKVRIIYPRSGTLEL